MNTKLINIIRTSILVLLPMILLSCSECEEVPYVDLSQIKTCHNYYTLFDNDNSTIKIISSDEDIDRYARQSIENYVADQIAQDPNSYYAERLQDESFKNKMITEIAECFRGCHVDFSQYNIAMISIGSIQSADSFIEEVCSDKINVYVIMEDHTDGRAYISYLQVPKGDYKLNVKKVRPPTGPY